MMGAVEKAGAKVDHKYGKNIFLGLDNAADSDDMFDPKTKTYHWQGENLSGDELVKRYIGGFEEFKHLLAFEDPFAAHESQWDFWAQLHDKLKGKMLQIGDDIFCSNPSLAYAGITRGVADSGLIKLNQVGSFSQAWMYMDLFHNKGLSTVISHRSTQPGTLSDPLEVTAALAASYKALGRVVLAKLGGTYLENRASLYYEMQTSVEEWRSGNAITSGMGGDVKIASITPYPGQLGAGKEGLKVKMILENGVAIVSPIPGGLSRGEKETILFGPIKGAEMVDHIVEKLQLVGKPLSCIGDVFEIEKLLMQMDIKMAQENGVLPSTYSKGDWDKFEEEAAYKRFVGGDVTLSFGQLMMKAVAMRDGIPPWLAYRQHGFKQNEAIGFSFANYPIAKQAFYEPIFTGQAGKGAIIN